MRTCHGSKILNTPQALAIIQALKAAETKGLRAEDYDGPRWDERTEILQQAKPARNVILSGSTSHLRFQR